MIKQYRARAAARQEARALQRQMQNASLLPEYQAYERAVAAYTQRRDSGDLLHGAEGERQEPKPAELSGEEVMKAAARLHARLTRDGVPEDQMQGVMQGLNERAEKAAGKTADRRGL